MYEAFCEVGMHMVLQGKELKTSLDAVEKTEAVLFGYILFDFREFESISIWSDEISNNRILGRTKYYTIGKGKLDKL